MEERREHDAVARPDAPGPAQPDIAGGPTQNDTPMQKPASDTHTSSPPDTYAPQLPVPAVDTVARQDAPRNESEREPDHAMEHAPSNPEQPAEDHDMGGLDPNNPDVQQQLRQQEMNKLMWLSLPENDQSAYYSDEDEEDSDCDWDEPGPSQYTNRNHKLRVKDGMRWIHRGKLGDWTEARADSELHEREDRRIHAFQHASVEALLEAEAHMIGSMGAMLRDPVQQKRRRMGMLNKRNKRRKAAYDEDNDLLSDDMDQEEQLSLSAATLAPSLLLPVLNAHDLLKSRLLKQVFNNSHITSLSRTALDLRESEHNMKHALGRCFGVMERIFDSDPRETDTNAVGTVNKRVNIEASTNRRSEMPQVEKSNDRLPEKADKHEEEGQDNGNSSEQHEVKDEQNESDLNSAEATYSAEAPADSPQVFDPLAPLDDAPPMAQINNLFLTKGGLTVPIPESNSESDAPQTITISEEEQRDIVYASLGCLNDLYMDSLEYMERLDEVRSILSDIERHRNHVWNMLRTWATKRDNEEYRASTMYRNARTNLRSARGSKSGSRNFGQGADELKASNTASMSVGDRGSGEYTGSSSRSRAKRRANK